MAVEWCRRMQHFYNLYKEKDIPMLVYSEKELSLYEESLDFVNMVLEAGIESPVWARAQAIRNLAPSTFPVLHKGASSSSGSK